MSNFVAVLLSIVAYLAVFAFGCALLVMFTVVTGISGGVATLVGLGWGVIVGVVAMLTALAAYDSLID